MKEQPTPPEGFRIMQPGEVIPDFALWWDGCNWRPYFSYSHSVAYNHGIQYCCQAKAHPAPQPEPPKIYGAWLGVIIIIVSAALLALGYYLACLMP